MLDTSLSIFITYLITYKFIFAASMGLLCGSFFNVVIYRMPIMLNHAEKNEYLLFCQEHELIIDSNMQVIEHKAPFNLAIPPSSCPNCKHSITPLENIPLLSYIFLRGKCRHCKKPISLRYPLIELITAVLSMILMQRFGLSSQFFAAAILTYILLILSMIDFDTQMLPDELTIPGLWLGLIINSYDIFTNLKFAVFGAIVGYLSLWLVYQAFKILTHKEGMGFGDFKLLALLGAWLGIDAIPFIILISSSLGSIVGIYLLLTKKIQRNEGVAFGPYLAIAGLIALLYQTKLSNLYLILINYPWI